MAIKSHITRAGISEIHAREICGDVSTGLTALGTTKDDAAVCQGAINIFGTVAAGTGVKLGAPIPQTIGSPVAAHHALSILSAGDRVTVSNQGANALLVYPPEGGAINGGVANTAVSLAAGAAQEFIFTSNINCISI